MRTENLTETAPASLPFRAADYLRTDAEVAAYIEAMLEDDEPYAVLIALRTVADALGWDRRVRYDGEASPRS